MVDFSHLIQVEHDIHIKHLLLLRETNPALEVQFWISANKANDYSVKTFSIFPFFKQTMISST